MYERLHKDLNTKAVLVTSEHKVESPVAQAQRLAKKLHMYKQTNTIIVATSTDTISLADILGTELQIPSWTHFCKPIKHPGNPSKTIGSITTDHVVLNNDIVTMPRDYIQHQIVMLQHALEQETRPQEHDYRGKNVIIARDCINSADDVDALIEFANAQPARAVLVATPSISREALSHLQGIVSEVFYLDINHHSLPWLSPLHT